MRDALRARGHDAWSCDVLPTRSAPEFHHQGDVIQLLRHTAAEWDLLIAFPPCTDLAVSGARYFAQKRADGRQAAALEFVRCLLEQPIPRIALENPVGVISSAIRRPDQIIQPWMFGHGETKATCLWLKNLPPLVPTNVVEGREQRVWRMPPSPERARMRSETYLGIAEAMAEQWGRLDAEGGAA